MRFTSIPVGTVLCLMLLQSQAMGQEIRLVARVDDTVLPNGETQHLWHEM